MERKELLLGAFLDVDRAMASLVSKLSLALSSLPANRATQDHGLSVCSSKDPMREERVPGWRSFVQQCTRGVSIDTVHGWTVRQAPRSWPQKSAPTVYRHPEGGRYLKYHPPGRYLEA